MQNPIFAAIDTTDLAEAKRLVGLLEREVAGFKLGLEFFSAHGPTGVREVIGNRPLFLDLKFNDIPNTVAGAVRAVLPLRPMLLTIHTNGGEAMMEAATAAASEAEALGLPIPAIIGVTVLTSLPATPGEVVQRALGAAMIGLDGVVCSPLEIATIREQIAEDFLLIVPGIRPEGSAADDQQRTATPKEAIRAGASVLVIGRPITQASDPVAATRAILASLE